MDPKEAFRQAREKQERKKAPVDAIEYSPLAVATCESVAAIINRCKGAGDGYCCCWDIMYCLMAVVYCLRIILQRYLSITARTTHRETPPGPSNPTSRSVNRHVSSVRSHF
jgi:hypothetical protein